MIGDIQKICCDSCGKYLFTEVEKQIKRNSMLSKTVRKDDIGNYIYTDDDRFICNDCYTYSLSLSHPLL